MESVLMFTKHPSREWIDGSRKRLGIAHDTRFTNPRVTLEIIIQILDELLQRLPRET